jgi:hypothetical protein
MYHLIGLKIFVSLVMLVLAYYLLVEFSKEIKPKK